MRREPEDIYDELLVLWAQDGDRASLEELLGRWEARIVRHAARLAGDHAEAMDVAQEAMMVIAQQIRKLRDPAAFGAWAYRVVMHKAADHVRRRVRERGRLRDVARAEGSGVDGDESRRVREAVRRLPLETQSMLALRYGEGHSVELIAEVVGRPVGSVKRRLHEAREELKGILGNTQER